MISILFFSFLSHAHIIGSSPWCLANSPVHYECYLLDQEKCEQDAKRRSKQGEDWQCQPFPIDFRFIPKSGETPVDTNLKK
jgi:hypothetical protein